MSNFWATRLAPSAPAAVAPAASPTTPWWMPNAPRVPQAQPVYQQPVQAPAAPQDEVDQQHQPGQWGSIAGSTQKATGSKRAGVCPECGSGNYGRPPGMANSMEQCYDCGYNSRFQQMAGQGGLPSDASGPTQAARQIAAGGGAGGVSNFNPGNIIAHI